MNKKVTSGIMLSICLGFLITLPLGAQTDLIRIQNLSGEWKFSIGEREEWLKPGYNDQDWETVFVPSPWEEQGFNGYNGFSTYRKSFRLQSEEKNKMLFLVLGYIDDVDETYVNGYKIGSSGNFPPHYVTAYNAKRVYLIPEEALNYDGENVIAVKVYDSHLEGGIVSGDVGLYTNRFAIPFDIRLDGKWKFRVGDRMEWKEPALNDSGWDEIFVPGKWEDQGYRNYDGFAWYRKSFWFKGQFKDEKVILVLGKIDDIDQVYVNGTLIGGTGEFRDHDVKYNNEMYKALRGYYFPAELLKEGKENVISVRVYDATGGGGIYEGPVGIINQKDYIRFWRNRKYSF